ncbi:hypothetical protein BU24DRAFT_425531 [Aaosphaeria arxii CBS 175.79]|uniref:Uncharacterized protein n=1 Tax=Aaosphaeria arxii CBS 175.79 TaxID=1450172 RepID=A0A6A5XII6_9PLEO|nr:uncharacterized protein BU24DRAFT_425531 [Aaosphaeria arxii CBS 175.79]KAF2012932.1 hypothetical protein BU24DRAFT_425531 [Aaosphaeria arxii CBS 175.79]
MKFDSKKTRARIQTGLERKWRKDDNSSPRFKVSREVGDILRLPNARETFNRWIRFKYPSIALDLSHDDFDDDPKPHRPSGKPNSTPKNNTSAGRKTPEPPKSVHSTPPPNATQTGSGPKDTQQGSGTNTAQQGEAPNTAQPGSGSTSAPTSNAPSPKPTGNKPPEGEDPDKSKPTKKPSKTDKKPVRKQPGGKGDKKNNPNDLSNVEKDYTDLSTVPDSEIEEWVKLTGPLSDTHEPGKDIWWDRFHLQKAFMGGWRHLERKKDENKESKESKKKEASRKRWKTGPAEVDTTLKKGGVDRVPGRLESMAKGKEVFDRRDHFELIPDHARKQVLMAQDDLKSRIGASATATAAGKAAKPAKEKRKHTAAEEGTEKPAKKPKGNATESEESSSQARPSVGEQTEDVAGSSADPATERGTKRDADDADVETARPEPSKRRKSD